MRHDDILMSAVCKYDGFHRIRGKVKFVWKWKKKKKKPSSYQPITILKKTNQIEHSMIGEGKELHVTLFADTDLPSQSGNRPSLRQGSESQEIIPVNAIVTRLVEMERERKRGVSCTEVRTRCKWDGIRCRPCSHDGSACSARKILWARKHQRNQHMQTLPKNMFSPCYIW